MVTLLYGFIRASGGHAGRTFIGAEHLHIHSM